jgi:hypothetical protein
MILASWFSGYAQSFEGKNEQGAPDAGVNKFEYNYTDKTLYVPTGCADIAD